MIEITLDNLREAAAGLVGVAERTPLVPLPISPDGETRLKAEHLQPIGAFKIRGAWTAVRRLSADARRHGVVTSSSGNHGLGIAFAAGRLGVRAVVVMPESAAKVKIEGVRRLGAEVVLAGKTRGPEQTIAAQGFVDQQGLTMIPPFDHPDVIAGQGTCRPGDSRPVARGAHHPGPGRRRRASRRDLCRRPGHWRPGPRHRGRTGRDSEAVDGRCRRTGPPTSRSDRVWPMVC